LAGGKIMPSVGSSAMPNAAHAAPAEAICKNCRREVVIETSSSSIVPPCGRCILAMLDRWELYGLRDVFLGGHSGQRFPSVASIAMGPVREKPGITPGGTGRSG